jgi:hypothetical protein
MIPAPQAFLLVRVFEVVKPCGVMTKEIYLKKIVPVGFLFAVSLWMSNTAYLYLSVAFIQMLKAMMPAVVYLVGGASHRESRVTSHSTLEDDA